MTSIPTQLAATESWFTEASWLGNAPWQWAALLGVILGGMVVGKLISFLLIRHADRLASRPGWEGLEATLRAVQRPAIMLLVVWGVFLARLFMDLSERVGQSADSPDLETVWLGAVSVATYVGTAWLIYRLVDVVEHYLAKWAASTETTFDDQLVPLVRKALRVFVVMLLALFILQNVMGRDISTILAGLGLGGLAFALAAKDTIANLFGSAVIFTDRPFKVGDRVVIDGYDGCIEEVGFRSTRIRTLTGTLVAIPNATVANTSIENIQERPSIKRSMSVTVTYDTSPEKIETGIAIIKDMLAARKDSFPEEKPGRVHFTDFGAASLDISVTYWFVPPEWEDYLAFTHDFNMELLRRFNDEGIEFAFPTQTLYLKNDDDSASQKE
jgi:MscS family membrane protein